jgi:hypothetical protein
VRRAFQQCQFTVGLGRKRATRGHVLGRELQDGAEGQVLARAQVASHTSYNRLRSSAYTSEYLPMVAVNGSL